MFSRTGYTINFFLKPPRTEGDEFAERMEQFIDMFAAGQEIDYILMGRFEMERLKEYFDNYRRKKKFAVVERDGEIIPMSYDEGVSNYDKINATEAKITFQTEEVVGLTFKGYNVVPIDEEFHFEPIGK